MVREKGGEQLFVRKVLKGRHDIYTTLQSFPHPCIPKLYEVSISDDTTEIIEEYVEGQPLSNAGGGLSHKQMRGAIRELCSVVRYLHEKGIIHRDIKPSNVMYEKDGHIRLIDFDAARMPKDDVERDTRLLGTRGYAPPEQYGFAQTDERADIYSLGVTLEHLLGEKADRPWYRSVIKKCTRLHPDERYQSVREVEKALFCTKRYVFCGAALLCLAVLAWMALPRRPVQQEAAQLVQEEARLVQEEAQPADAVAAPAVLPAPENPRWDGETGIALWGNVPDSGTEEEVAYNWKLYRQDTETPPDPETSECYAVGSMRGNGGRGKDFPVYDLNLGSECSENGFYYFMVSAKGNGVTFTDSPYVMSDAFHYTGEDAPPLPAPTGLAWLVLDYEGDGNKRYHATWSNLDDYADTDSFNVCVYNEAGEFVRNNIWTKEFMLSKGLSGIQIDARFFEEPGGYRFTVQALTSRPNEYKSSPEPDLTNEEVYSPWHYN